jgi:hypothetical protein
LASALAFGMASLPSGDVAAQGTMSPVDRQNTSCPTGWRNSQGEAGREDIRKCYPRGNSQTTPIYLNNDRDPKPCAPGYGQDGRWCRQGAPAGRSSSSSSTSSASSSSRSSSSSSSSSSGSAGDRMASFATLKKRSPLDRCPIGYFSKSDMSVCTTRLSNGTRSRFKTGPCNAGEIDEWNLYCTEGTSRITRDQAETEATGDFNYIYTANGGRPPTQTPSGDDVDNSPPMVAAFGIKPPRNSGSSPASSSSSSAQATASTSDIPVPANCPAPSQASAAGAALGGLLGGRRNSQAAAALGGLLGAAAGGQPKPAGCP